jgi:hypothetical protein
MGSAAMSGSIPATVTAPRSDYPGGHGRAGDTPATTGRRVLEARTVGATDSKDPRQLLQPRDLPDVFAGRRHHLHLEHRRQSNGAVGIIVTIRRTAVVIYTG